MQFFNLLFDPHEYIWTSCTYQGKPKGQSLEASTKWFDSCKLATENGILVGLNPTEKGWTLSANNVTVYRNLLIECDDISVEEQLKLIKRCRLPYTTLTHTGNKSVHCVISLETPCTSLAEYQELHRRLVICLESEPDRNTKNPAQTTKIPKGKRLKPNGVECEQWNLSQRKRVSSEELASFFALHQHKLDIAEQANNLYELLKNDIEFFTDDNFMDDTILVKTKYLEAIDTKDGAPYYRAPCPSCRSIGKDSKGDHLSINKDTGYMTCHAACEYSAIMLEMRQYVNSH